MSRPPALRQGDGVAVVAPSSPFARDRFERGVRALQEMGFEPRFGEGIHARHVGYLAGPDTRRLDELLRALRDPSARAIVLARGGYGLLRIAPAVPRELVTKPVVGYSDATILHEIWSRAGVPSVHGPMCTQLVLAGAFAGAIGFVVGDLAAPGEDNDGRDEAVAERLSTVGVPVVLSAPFGHGQRNEPVALGVPHALDAEQGALTQLEPMLEKSATA